VTSAAVRSLFDLLRFAAPLIVFRAGPALFRTRRFVESLLTDVVIALVRSGCRVSRHGPVSLASEGAGTEISETPVAVK
jgi:hypothetical protein